MNLPKAIAALPKWADTTRSRYPLECVRIKADGQFVFAEATDGRRLCRLTWHCTGVEGEYRLKRDVLSKALRAVGLRNGGYFASITEADWSSQSPITNVRFVGKIPAIMLYGKNCGQVVPSEDAEREWPKTEQVLYPPEGSTRDTIDTYWLRDKARAVLKADPKATPPAMDLQVGPVTMRMDAKYLRDMAETAIQCGYDEVWMYVTDPQNGVHFWANNYVQFESVIMPLAQD
jgi:hypothetical protein